MSGICGFIGLDDKTILNQMSESMITDKSEKLK